MTPTEDPRSKVKERFLLSFIVLKWFPLVLQGLDRRTLKHENFNPALESAQAAWQDPADAVDCLLTGQVCRREGFS